MECWRCHSYMDEGASFCSVCGASLGSRERWEKAVWRNCSFRDMESWFKENGRNITVIWSSVKPYYHQQEGWYVEYAEIRYYPRPDGSAYGIWWSSFTSYEDLLKTYDGEAYTNNRELEFKRNCPGILFLKHFNRSVHYPGGQGMQTHLRLYLYKYPPEGERADAEETIRTQGWAKTPMRESSWKPGPIIAAALAAQALVWLALTIMKAALKG